MGGGKALMPATKDNVTNEMRTTVTCHIKETQ